MMQVTRHVQTETQELLAVEFEVMTMFVLDEVWYELVKEVVDAEVLGVIGLAEVDRL